MLIVDGAENIVHRQNRSREYRLLKEKPVLIVANEIEGDAMQGIVLNKVKGGQQNKLGTLEFVAYGTGIR